MRPVNVRTQDDLDLEKNQILELLKSHKNYGKTRSLLIANSVLSLKKLAAVYFNLMPAYFTTLPHLLNSETISWFHYCALCVIWTIG